MLDHKINGILVVIMEPFTLIQDFVRHRAFVLAVLNSPVLWS